MFIKPPIIEAEKPSKAIKRILEVVIVLPKWKYSNKSSCPITIKVNNIPSLYTQYTFAWQQNLICKTRKKSKYRSFECRHIFISPGGKNSQKESSGFEPGSRLLYMLSPRVHQRSHFIVPFYQCFGIFRVYCDISALWQL